MKSFREHAEQSTQHEAEYRAHPNGKEKCSDCNMFMHPDECTAVQGIISPEGWCKYFEKESVNESDTLHQMPMDHLHAETHSIMVKHGLEAHGEEIVANHEKWLWHNLPSENLSSTQHSWSYPDFDHAVNAYEPGGLHDQVESLGWKKVTGSAARWDEHLPYLNPGWRHPNGAMMANGSGYYSMRRPRG